MTVEGVVTASAKLLDADGRRQTIQDGGGAILVRWPVGVSAPAIGQRVRVSGEVGTYYGAPQIATNDQPNVIGRADAGVHAVARAPISSMLEWRLVRVTGIVESVHRSGDAWRAEIQLAGGSIPIVGLARSGIGADALVKGRPATITGLVKRAYPTATDQRFAVVPRASADIRLGAAGASPGASANPSQPAGQPAGSAAPGSTDGSTEGSAMAAAVELADLAGHEGRRVMVGGRLASIAGDHLLLDDGTAQALVMLEPAARGVLARLRPGVLVNAVGRVARSAAGGLLVRVADSADITIGAIQAPARPSDRPSPVALTPRPAISDGGTAAGSVEAESAPDGLTLMLGALVVLGAVTGSATAFFARGAAHRQAIRELKLRLRGRLSRLRSRLATLIRP